MSNTNGRLEKELFELNKIEQKINTFPTVIKDFYYYLVASEKSYTTIKTYINYISSFMNFCTDGKYQEDFYKTVTPTMINTYMSSIRYKRNSKGEVAKVGNEIRATRWSALNTFFTYLKANNLIDNNPLEKTFRPPCKKDKGVTYLTENEINICLNNIKEDKNKRFVNRDMCIISLGISIGLRVSAIAQINIEDIDFENSTIQVIEKGNKYRIMHFGDNLRQKLLLWIDDRNKYYPNINTNALFISRKKHRISVSAIEDLLKKYTENIDKNITPHKLRATCATNLYKKTGDIYLVANQLGHANIATTKIYTDVDMESKLKATEILDKLI